MVTVSKLRERLQKRWLRVVIFLLIALMAGAVGYWKFAQPQEVAAGWFDNDWLYRKRIPISYGGSEYLTEYQVLIDGFDTATLVTNGQLQSDCDDLRFIDDAGRDLPYYIVSTTCNTSDTEIWVQVAEISATTRIWVYYGNPQATMRSDELETFSYSQEKPVAYVLDSSVDALEVISLADNNSISHNGTTLSLDRLGSLGTFSSISQYGVISATKPFQADDLSDDTDQSVPISWAGTEFMYLARNGGDSYSAIAPWGTASVDIWLNGVSTCTNQSVATTGTTISGCTSTGGVVRIESDVPILIFHEDGNGDPHPLHPADLGPWYGGAGSTSMFSGANGASAHQIRDSVTTVTDVTMPADTSSSAGGSSFGASGFKLWSDDYPITAHQQADGDGSDATMFRLGREMGTIWGSSASNTDYVTLVSNQAATCIMYNASNNSQITSVTLSSSNTQAYFAGIGTGASTSYTTADWYLKCDNPVAAYYQKGGSSESGMQTTIDMRQFTYPTPAVGTPGSEEVGAQPVQWLAFDDMEGITAEDRMAQEDDGTVNGGAEWVDSDMCRTNGCLKFDGTDDYVNLSGDSFITTQYAGSISIWVRSLDPTDTESIVYTAENKDRYIYIDNGYFKASMHDSNLNDFRFLQGPITDTDWHHLVFTWNIDTGTLVLYVDGAEADRYEGSGWATVTVTHNNFIAQGRSANASMPAVDYFQGFLDEFQVFEGELSPEAVRRLYVGASYLGSSAAFAPDFSSLSTGLVGYWKLDESAANGCTGATNDSCDSSGSNADGAWNGDATVAQGKYGHGVTFDGTGDYVSMNDTFHSDAMTVCTWFNADTVTGTKNMVIKRNSSGITSGTNEWQFVVVDGILSFASWDSGGSTAVNPGGTTTLSTGTWYHACAVQYGTGKTAYVYLNGEIDGAAVQANTMRDSSSPIQLGVRSANTDTRYWDGELDEVRVYDRALSHEEIYLLSRFSPNPIAEYRLDENTGTSSTADTSGNGYSGTLTSITAESWAPGKYGSALHLDGAADYVNAGDWDVTTQAFSLAGWIKLDTVANNTHEHILSKWKADTSDRSFMLAANYNGTGNVALGVSDVGTNYLIKKTDDNVLQANTWHFVTATYDAGTFKIYIDGVEYTTTTSVSSGAAPTGAPEVNATEVRLGGAQYESSAIQYFDGALDQLQIYDYALSPEQVVRAMVRADADSLATSNIRGSLRAKYSFDEGITGSCVGASNSGANIAYEEYTSYAVQASGTSVSFSHTVTAGDELALVVVVNAMSHQIDTDPFDVSSVTYNGENLTQAFEQDHYQNNRDYATSIWYLLDPPTGSNTVAVTTNNGIHDWVVGALTFSGVNQSDPIGDFDGAGGSGVSSLTASLTTESDNSFIVGGAANRGDWGTLSLSSGTEVFSVNNGNTGDTGLNGLAGYLETTTAGSYNFTVTAGTNINVIGAVELKTSLTQNDVCDSSGHLNDGLLHAAVSTPSGYLARGIFFDGNTDYIEIPDSPTLNPSEAISGSLWVNLENPTTNYEYLLAKGDVSTSAGRSYELRMNGTTGKPQLVISDGTTVSVEVSGNTAIAANTWTHVGFSWTPARARIYINGQIDAEAASARSTINNDSYPLRIGSDIGNLSTRTVEGVLDEVKLYGYELTEKEMGIDFNGGAAIRLGSLGTSSDQSVSNNAQSLTYCVPGDTTTCDPPLFEYLLDEGTGTMSVGDTSPHRRTGTLNGSMTAEDWVPGRFGNALDFDGSNDYISVVNDAALQTNNFTITAWVYPRDNADGIITKGSSRGAASSRTVDIFQNGSTLQAVGSDGVSTYIFSLSTNTLPLFTWSHIALSWDGTTNTNAVKLYVNGKLVSSTTSSSTSLATTNNWNIGGEGTYVFDGVLDQVRMYGYARSARQINWEYLQGAPFMQYRFDECAGDVIYNSAPTASSSATVYNASLSVGGSGTNTFKGSCDSGVAADAWYDGRDGKENASIYLDGTDDYVSCGAGLISEAPELPITMSAWIYKVAGGGYIGTGYDGIIALSDGTNYAGVSLGLLAQSGTNYKFSANVGDNTGNGSGNRRSKESAGFEIAENEWTHVAAVIRSGTDIELYVNGNEVPGTYNGTGGGIAWAGTECVIGKSWGSAEYYFHGKIDDVKVFPYDLSADQMKTLYNNGAVSFGN